MVIYADILFITNLYIDFFLLYCVRQFFHLKIKTYRLIIGALVGAVCSFSALLPNLPKPISFLLGFGAALLITAIAFLPIPLQMYIKASISFWTFSFSLAGILMLVVHFFSPEQLMLRNGTIYFHISPLVLFLFTCFAYLVLSLSKWIMSSRAPTQLFFRITVEHLGQSVELSAKSDTGNTLKEPFSTLPVIVTEFDAARKIVPYAVSHYLETGEADGKLRLIPFHGIEGGGVLPAFKPDEVYTSKGNHPLECYLAICNRKLSAGQFDALFNPEIFADMPKEPNV